MNVLYLAESVLCFINGVQKFINGFYNCLLTLGQIVVSIIIEIFWFCSKVIESSIHVCIILQEDFELFKCELQTLCRSAVELVTDFFQTLWTAVDQACILCMTSREVIHSTSYICRWLQINYEQTYTLVVDSLSLIGNGFLYCINFVQIFFSTETYFGFVRKLKKYVNKIILNFRHEAFFGLLVVVCVTALVLKSKFHLKVVKIIKGFVLNIAVASRNGCKLLLMGIPPILIVVRRSWKNTTNYLCSYVKKERSLSKLNEEDLQRLLEQEKAEKLCIICMERKRSIMLMHCQHFILCDMCVLTILQEAGFCPVCRSNISSVLTVYT